MSTYWVCDVSLCARTYFQYFHFLPLRSITSDSQHYTCGCLSLFTVLSCVGCELHWRLLIAPHASPSFFIPDVPLFTSLTQTLLPSLPVPFAHIISFTFFSQSHTLSLSVPHILSVSSPPSSSRPLRGLRDFAFVCDRRVNGAQGWGEILGFCPKLWGENHSLIASCLLLVCQRLSLRMDSWVRTTTPHSRGTPSA